MAHRTTRKELNTLVEYLATEMGVGTEHYTKVSNHRWKAVMGAIALDHSSVYGGYELHQINSDGGGVKVLSGDRKTAREMAIWLRGVLSNPKKWSR